MKLHLPLSLRSSLLALMLVAAGGYSLSSSQAAVLHKDVSMTTYADFGQNAGRYAVGVTNELLQYVNRGGVVLTYTGNQPDYVLPNGMIDFGSGYHRSTAAAISVNCVATVKHNGAISSDFTSQYAGIGSENSIKYKAIEIADNRTFVNSYNKEHNPNNIGGGGHQDDHKVTRLSKIVTDVSPAGLYDTAAKGINGKLFYHAGCGHLYTADYSGPVKDWANSYAGYVMGGVTTVAGYNGNPSGAYAVYQQMNYGSGGVNGNSPLPWISQPGDSGSPVYVWDKDSQTFQYFGGTYGGEAGNRVTVIASNTTFDQQIVDSYHEYVDMSDRTTVYLNAVVHDGETKSEGGYSTQLKYGQVTDADDNVLTNAAGKNIEYYGVAAGQDTWKDLSGLKDTQNWYAYDNSYLQQSVENLFFTENLVFTSTASENSIVLKDTVDLGVGYAEFRAGGEGPVSYTIKSEQGNNGVSEGNLLNSAGFVVNGGVSLHLQLTNPAAYVREWRKVGAGDLYIEGSGNNDILLNIGGSGKTYLNRQNGYAAYNVLVNNGATIIISDVNQIKRDLTFGNRGGTLNMNGQSMDWYQTAEAEGTTRNGFSINALTEAALIANDKGSSTLTYKETKDSTYVGSFADTASASLKIVHDSDATWTLNSIRTNLQHEDSGLLVNRGTVVLKGTNTVHAYGSDLSSSDSRYFHGDDWHYADARMNVAVNGGTFELGSHARLTGDVTVQKGGTFVMREGVCHQMEYVEGGARLEDTDQYSAYFGHKGDVVLNGGTFAVQFNEGADSTLEYAGNVTGQGSMTVDAGVAGGTLSFSGTVDAGVSKTLERGLLVLTGAAAADTSNKWLVKTGGVMTQLDNVSDTLAVIDGASSGIIGLKGGVCTEQFDFSATHSQLGIGALAGQTVQYGAEGTTESLRTLNLGGWGKLVVNYVLSGADTLNVDAGGMSGGEVSLQQVAEGYSGTVNVQSEGGQMTLTTAQNGALDAATVNLNEGGVWKLAEGQSVGGTVNINHGGLLETDLISGGSVNVNSGGLLRGADVALTGGSVELAGNMAYDSFTVTNGATLNLRAGGRLDADNAATIAQGGIMRLNTQTLQDKVELKNGGTMYGNGGTIGASAAVTATEGTGVISAGGGSMTINGAIGAAKGATLRLENGAVNFNAQYINSAGGTLELACGAVELAHRVNGTTQYIDGTLNIAENVTITVNQGNPNAYQSIEHKFNHIHITQGKKLTLIESRNDWRHVFNVDSISGQGEIVWKTDDRWFTHTAKGPSRLILEGENSFKGTLLVNQLDNHGSMQHVSLAHDYAGRDMVINMWGDENSRPALAISTNNAHVAGIGGTAHTFVYAGAVKTSGDGNNPVSTALNTLTINTAGVNHTYHGTILGDATNGLNIVKTGEGEQTFMSGANVVHDVMALQGHLNFTAAPTIHGDVSIAQGAELSIGSGSYSLVAGKTLNVLAGSADMQAVLHNSLELRGGTICFGAYGSEPENAALSIQASSPLNSDSVTLAFENKGMLQLGTTYYLVNGDWSAYAEGGAGVLTVKDSAYLNAAVTAGRDGLSVSFSMKDGYAFWEGDCSVLESGKTVVFNDGTESVSALVASNQRVAHAYFDNMKTLTLPSAENATLRIGTLNKSGAGDLEINAAVNVEEMNILQASALKGSGSLAVSHLNIQADLTSNMGIAVDEVSLASGSTWTLDGSEHEFTQELTLAQVNSINKFRVEGDAVLSVEVTGEGTLAAAIQGSGRTSFTGGGTLTKNSSATLNLADAALTKLELLGNGTTNISGNVSLSGQFSIGKGTVNIQEGAVVSANRFTAGNAADDSPSVINIDGGELKVTGTTNDNTTYNSFLLAHWQRSGTVMNLLSGKLESKGAVLNTSWDTAGTFNALGGEADLLGINLKGHIDDRNGAFNLGAQSAGNAVVRLGEQGIKGLEGGASVTLGNGTLAASADFCIDGSNAVSLVGKASGTVFDTAGHTITVNTVMQGDGKLVVNGSGSLKLAHASGVSDIADLSGTGNLVKDGAGNLNLHKVSLANATFKGNGTVNISGEVNLSGEMSVGKGVVNLLNGASVTTSRYIAGNTENNQGSTVVINEGAELVITGATDTDKTSASFMLTHWKDSASTLTLDGGSLSALNTCLHMGWDSAGRFEALSGEATLKGIRFSLERDDHADSFILGAATVKIGSGGITDFSGNDTVQLGDGTILAMEDFRIQGNSSIKLYGTADTGTVFDANGHTITIDAALDAEGGAGSSAMTVRNGTVQQSGTMWIQRLNIAKGAAFVKNGVTVQGLSDASVIEYLGSGEDKLDYSGNGNHEISDAAVQVNSASEKEVKTKLTNTSVENAGSGLLTLSNSSNTLSGLHATGGNIKVTGIETAAVAELEIAANKTITAANVVVSELARLEAGATLAGNLELANSATIELGGEVTLNGMLNLQTGLTLSGAVLDAVQGLEVGESYTLFTGVNGLNVQSLQQAVTLYNMRSLAEQTNDAVSYSALMDGGQVAAAGYFSNLEGDRNLVLSYNSAEGTVSITHAQAVPEPTTATLSLLALAGLCARRRRR